MSMASREKPADPRRPFPRLYLVTPQNPAGLADRLTEALDAADVAAVLLRLPPADERTRVNHAKALAPTVQGKGAALLLDGYPDLAARAGADGAHLSGVDAFMAALATLKPARICKHPITERHEIGTGTSERIHLVERGGESHAWQLEHLRPPGDPLDDCAEGRPMAARFRLAEHDVVGAGFAGEHGIVPGRKPAAAGNARRPERRQHRLERFDPV